MAVHTSKPLAREFGGAVAYPCDVINRESWIATLATIIDDMGQPDYVYHTRCFWVLRQAEQRNEYLRKRLMRRCHR